MKRISILALLVLVLAAAFSFAQDRPSAQIDKASKDKCMIDLQVVPSACDLSKSKDERLVWVNKSDMGLYVCGNPKNEPFEAYAWYVPAGGKRRSGKIMDSAAIQDGYLFDVTSSPCGSPTTQSGTESKGGGPPQGNPKIIVNIKP